MRISVWVSVGILCSGVAQAPPVVMSGWVPRPAPGAVSQAMAARPSRDSHGERITCARADTLDELVECIYEHMPVEGSNGFVPPTPGEQRDWRSVVAEMLVGDCSPSLPASLAGIMRRREFVDSGVAYCVLMEVEDGDGDGYVDRGWGTFIVHAAAIRELSHQAPHPLFDTGTAVEAVKIFRDTGSRSYLMCGAHRRANAAYSACNGARGDYRVSDCAHSKANMYYPTTVEIDAYYGGAGYTQIQWHGMADDTCPQLDVYISHGLRSAPPQASRVRTLLSKLEAHHPGWRAAVPGSAVCKLNGTENIAGRFLNGVADAAVCTRGARASTGKFVHIEQVGDVREASDWTQPIAETWP